MLKPAALVPARTPSFVYGWPEQPDGHDLTVMSAAEPSVQQWLDNRLRLARALCIDTTEGYFSRSAEDLTTFVSFRNEASAAATVLKQLTEGRAVASTTVSLVPTFWLRSVPLYRARGSSWQSSRIGLLAQSLPCSGQASSDQG